MDLPVLGMGCAPPPGQSAAEALPGAIRTALHLGCRLFDTAEVYGSESVLGRTLHTTGAPARENLFLTSKVWQTNHAPKQVLAACRNSLRRLGLDYLDLYLIHAPQAWAHIGDIGDLCQCNPEQIARRTVPLDSEGRLRQATVNPADTWQAMLTLKQKGRVKAIGVSNFTVDEIRQMVQPSGLYPDVVQITRHLASPAADTLAFCHRHNIAVIGHSLLRTAGYGDHPHLAELALKHNCQPIQIVLAWNIHSRVIPIFGSLNHTHIADNLKAANLRLDRRDMQILDALSE